jgi:hypothetical protein
MSRELSQHLVQEAAGGVEFTPDCGVFGVVEDGDYTFPALAIALRQSRFYLAYGLSGEQEAASRVVQNRACDLELSSRPAYDLLAGMGLELFGSQHVHAGSIVRQGDARPRP